jgi:hypothetical protein
MDQIESAVIAIDAHTAARGLDDEGDRANIGLWHLLRSLVLYCDRERVDFMATLEDAQGDIRATGE